MLLCKVVGSVVSTQKQEIFRGSKLLLVQEVDLQGKERPEAKRQIALDPRFDAGTGDYVLVAHEGKAAAQVMATPSLPANVIIVGIVDDWSCADNPS